MIIFHSAKLFDPSVHGMRSSVNSHWTNNNSRKLELPSVFVHFFECQTGAPSTRRQVHPPLHLTRFHFHPSLLPVCPLAVPPYQVNAFRRNQRAKSKQFTIPTSEIMSVTESLEIHSGGLCVCAGCCCTLYTQLQKRELLYAMGMVEGIVGRRVKREHPHKIPSLAPTSE